MFRAIAGPLTKADWRHPRGKKRWARRALESAILGGPTDSLQANLAPLLAHELNCRVGRKSGNRPRKVLIDRVAMLLIDLAALLTGVIAVASIRCRFV